MAFLFGGARPSGMDSLRNFTSQTRASVRGIERELKKVDTQEASLLRQLKKCGQTQAIDEATAKARELVRLRGHRKRLQGLRANMVGMAQELSEVGASQKTQEMIGKTTHMLQRLNEQLNVAGTHRLMVEFERQSVEMSSKQEIVDDALDTAFTTENEAGLSEEAVRGVLEEAGFDEAARLAKNIPGSAGRIENSNDMELEERFRALKQN